MKKTLFFLLLLIFPPLLLASDGSTSSDMGERMTRLILELALIIIVARGFGYFFTRVLKQPAVLGELCAGMIIGPYALGSLPLPFIGPLFMPHHSSIIPLSAELYGIATLASIILLFLVGLETDVTAFLKYSVAGTFVGIGGLLFSFIFGDLLAIFFGVADSFLDPKALFLGAILTATSVGITARVLSDQKKLDSPEGVTILAGAVIDDVFGIIVLAIVVGISKASGMGEGDIEWKSISMIAIKAFGFWIICTALGLLLARKITKVLKWFKSTDLIASLSLGLALLLAGLSELAGLAMIIGAYIVGLSLSRTDLVNEVHNHLKGIYSILVPIFFCTMGMLVDFQAMKGVILFGLVYTAFAFAGKIFGCGIPALFMGFNLRGAARIGIGMLPRGEVALIIAGIGLSSGIVGPEIFGVAIMMTLMTTIAAPPAMMKVFKGDSGLRKPLTAEETQLEKITITLPNADIAEFVTTRLVTAFRNEEFFVHRADSRLRLFQIRKDDIVMTLTQRGGVITVETKSKYESLARFVMAEEMLDLEGVFEAIEGIVCARKISADLISGALNWKA